MSNKPFIIKMQNFMQPVVPVDSEVFDQNQ